MNVRRLWFFWKLFLSVFYMLELGVIMWFYYKFWVFDLIIKKFLKKLIVIGLYEFYLIILF